MENAAKALTIAGGVLIAVMLTVLVYYVFTHWGDSQKAQSEEVEVQRVEEFNKSYLSYEKVLYGSELLGLVNKMSDYNISEDVEYNGFEPMELSMKIDELSGSTDNLFSKGTYNIQQIIKRIDDIMKVSVNDSAFTGKISDSQWEYLAKSGSSTYKSFKSLCDKLGVSNQFGVAEGEDVTDSTIEKLQSAAKEYYKYIQFKRMKFKHIETTFFNNGRVESMSYEETK